MELRVNDYVRTKSGYIDKIININDFREPSMKYALEQPSWNDDIVFIGKEDIIKSSPNIIDLIEKNDLVVDYGDNIYQVYKVYNGYVYTTMRKRFRDEYITLVANQIKSIVTKEQFESMKYEIYK